ncbi:hypothetical protein HYS91_02480 [Candidatus Daviesbacteria bacterium]|nr:hypothetical protein [Candidatus Daviesbacteria bacterium]
MLNKVLTWSFYILFFATPLVWASFTSELFELNKMFLVYFLTIVITTTWVIKMVLEKKLIFKKTPLSMPLLLFLGANFLSTVFSSDAHLSIYGYHSRLNGGLLSIISYTLLYFALTSNFGKEQIINFLRTILLGGFLVSLYAIPEHFGVSPSCLILTGSLNADCWVQDVEARVFATLGQPNWHFIFTLQLNQECKLLSISYYLLPIIWLLLLLTQEELA